VYTLGLDPCDRLRVIWNRREREVVNGKWAEELEGTIIGD